MNFNFMMDLDVIFNVSSIKRSLTRLCSLLFYPKKFLRVLVEGRDLAVELVAMAEELQQAQTFHEKHDLRSSLMNFQWKELAAA